MVVMHGNRVEEFEFESASRKQLRGNIYLAKVTRVEPSLQAAFVDYGGTTAAGLTAMIDRGSDAVVKAGLDAAWQRALGN